MIPWLLQYQRESGSKYGLTGEMVFNEETVRGSLRGGRDCFGRFGVEYRVMSCSSSALVDGRRNEKRENHVDGREVKRGSAY